jgi:hypothetical protein
MLLNALEDSAILKTDQERERYKLVRDRLKQEFEYEPPDLAGGRIAPVPAKGRDSSDRRVNHCRAPKAPSQGMEPAGAQGRDSYGRATD